MGIDEALASIYAHIDELAERYTAELWMMRCLALASIARSAGQHRRWLKRTTVVPSVSITTTTQAIVVDVGDWSEVTWP